MGGLIKPGSTVPRPNPGRGDHDETNLEASKSNDDQVPVNNNKGVTNKIKEALMLPTCMNLNPPSIYNKAQEFITFIKEHSIHCVFLSESWERPEFNLSQLLDIEDFMVISNPHQRTGQGGRPALLVNTKYYHVRTL